jgi:hypothetical protein
MIEDYIYTAFQAVTRFFSYRLTTNITDDANFKNQGPRV